MSVTIQTSIPSSSPTLMNSQLLADTFLGRVVSQFIDCAQSQIQIENCLQKLNGRVVQKAHEGGV